jgi:hypothetical protein
MTAGTRARGAGAGRLARGGRVFSVFVGTMLLAACSSAATTAPTESTVTTASATPTAAAETSALPTIPEATGVATSLDPCVLVTASEASSLAGATFGAGKESTTSGNGKICTYGAQTLTVFSVLVGQAPDVATAQAGKTAAEAGLSKLASKGIQFTELPNFADGAAYYVGGGTISGQTINIGAMYVLKGTVFFGFSDLVLNNPAPTAAALQAQATVVLGRLP